MAQVLKVGSRDLSPYVRVAHDDGLDPANPEFSEPQFSGSPALGDGQSFVGDAVNNRQMSYPLILSADSTDELYELVREINADLVKGAQVEYRSGGASQSTFFDLERGRLEPKFEFWIDQAAKVRAMLHLWVRPYGHTGTTRLIASGPQSTGVQLLTATGVLGDVAADGILRVRTPNLVVGDPMMAYGVKYPAASGFAPVFAAASIAPQNTATIRGASGRLASQYVAAAFPANGQEDIFRVTLRPQDFGRYRVFAVMRHYLYAASGHGRFRMRNEDPFDSSPAVENEVSLESVADKHWKLVDFGEYNYEHGRPQLSFDYLSGGGGSYLATYPFQMESVVLLPLDGGGAGIFRDDGKAQLPAAHYEFDSSQGAVRRYTLSATSVTPSGYTGDRYWRLRGALPQISPVGSPLANRPAQIVAFHADTGWIDSIDMTWHNQAGFDLSVRERFTYLR